MGISAVREHDFGVYLWQMPDGSLVTDQEHNYLSINSMRGDGKRIAEITAAARQCGLTEGHPIFFNARKVTDEEYEIQRQRAEEGNIPDELDIGAYVDAERERKLKHQDDRNT